MEATKIHIFEEAGLGYAPFRFLRFEHKTYQACPGAPVQVGGSCDYCGTGIKNMYHLQSADGRHFKVGCICIKKAGDTGLKRIVKKQEAKSRRARSAENYRLDLAYLQELLNVRRDDLDNLNRTEYVEFMIKNAGHSGMARAAKAIRKALADNPSWMPNL